MKKTIIGVYGTANIGKSKTINRLGHLIGENGGSSDNNINFYDYFAVFSYKSACVGIQTYGDYKFAVEEGLGKFKEQNCEVIVIASKQYGGTVDVLNEFAKDNDFRVIWVTPYQVLDGSIDIDELKNYSAQHLLRMVNDVIDGSL